MAAPQRRIRQDVMDACAASLVSLGGALLLTGVIALALAVTR